MTKPRLMVTGISALALTLIACSPQAAEPTATPAAPAEPTPMAGMNMATPPAAAAGPITATGKITAIDAKAGTLTLDHEAIPAVKWDAMSMQFNADPANLADLKVGDAVSFELRSASEPTQIVKIDKQ